MYTTVSVVRYTLAVGGPIDYHWGIMLCPPATTVLIILHLKGRPGGFDFQWYTQRRAIETSDTYSGHLPVGFSIRLSATDLKDIISGVPIVELGEQGWADYDCRVWTELVVRLLQEDYFSLDAWPQRFNPSTGQTEFRKLDWSTIEHRLDEMEYVRDGYTLEAVRAARRLASASL
jgi:hypothetical protein